MQAQRTTWLVRPGYTWAGGGYFGPTPADSLEHLGRLLGRIADVLKRQEASAGVLLLDPIAAKLTGMSEPMADGRHRALDAAAASGWQSGALGAWTVFYGVDRPKIHVGLWEVLQQAAAEDERHWPFNHEFPGDVVAMLQAWHDLTGVAWQAGASVMGKELMHKTISGWVHTDPQTGKQQRRKTDLRDDATPDDAQVMMWAPSMWSARGVPGRWLHGYDKARAGITAAGIAKLSPAKLRRSRRQFDPKRAGWWQVEVPAWNVPEMPHPFGPGATAVLRRVGGNRMWVTTATMDLAAELALEGVISMPEVIDSWTGPARPVLADWSKLIETAYAAPTRGEYDETAQEWVRGALKLAGNAGLGLVGKYRRDEDSSIPSIWRRDWFFAVNATKQANAFRTAWKVLKQEKRGPVAFSDDKIYYASDNPDPYKAAPALLAKGLDKGTPGTYRWETTQERKRKRT